MFQSSYYPNLYECNCPIFNRSLPFRKECCEKIIKDIRVLFSNTQAAFTYVSVGSGGLFFDYLFLNQLIQHGYTTITIIIIEPLYDKKIDVIRAAFDFKKWCIDIQPKAYIKPYFFKSFREYTYACKENYLLKSDIMVTIDPQGANMLPDFDKSTFKKKFLKTISNNLNNRACFYYLFFDGTYRNFIQGYIQQHHVPIIAYSHFYGINHLQEHAINRAFYQTDEVLPLETIKHCIQINNTLWISEEYIKILTSPIYLWKSGTLLLQAPLFYNQ